MAKKKEPKAIVFTEKELEAQALEREERENAVNDTAAIAVSKFDQHLVQRAKELGINPLNFATEEELTQAVRIVDQTSEESNEG